LLLLLLFFFWNKRRREKQRRKVGHIFHVVPEVVVDEAPAVEPALAEQIRPKRTVAEARELARSGARDAARNLLSQLQQMMEGLKQGRLMQQQPGQGQGQGQGQAMQELSDLMQKQQELMDRSFRQGQQVHDLEAVEVGNADEMACGERESPRSDVVQTHSCDCHEARLLGAFAVRRKGVGGESLGRRAGFGHCEPRRRGDDPRRNRGKPCKKSLSPCC
jgi:hypothetical protein